MKRYAVRFAYLGDGFSGSQVQPGLRTVEGEMLSAMTKVCGLSEDELDLRIASRTDKGVNATGNVAAFHTDFNDPSKLLRALNAVSDGVFYTAFAEIEESFNPRHANSRGYRYVLPLKDHDIDLARECAALFVGEHDFSRFCRPDGKSPIVTIDSLDVTIEGDSLILTYRARYFLWNMVRRTAAAISSVASGHSSIDDVRSALDGQEINFGMARADALTLTDVTYDGLAFTPASNTVLGDKVEDGLFSSSLRAGFYRSIL